MGPKYEFTDETMDHKGHTLHRIKRLSDGHIGGWIESEANLSQDGNCWVDDEAKVYNDAKVCDNAQVYDTACVCFGATVYGDAQVFGNAGVLVAEVYDNAKVYGNASIRGNAKIYGNAKVYGEALIDDEAQVYGNAEVYDRTAVYEAAQVYGNAKVYGRVSVYGYIKLSGGNFYNINSYHQSYYDYNYCEDDVSNEDLSHEDDSLNNVAKEVVQDFIYKVNDSNKLTTQTEYDSVDEFFSEPAKNDIKLDTLIICTVDTKEPLIKLQKVETENKTEFKFIVDIINEDGDNFMFKSVIKSQDQLNKLVQQTIEALKNYSKFNKYADDLEEYL